MAATLNRPVVLPAGSDTAFKIVGSFAASCFVGALACDLVYWRAPDFLWVTFSVWLITIGLIVAGLAAVVGLFDRMRRRQLGMLSTRWPYLAGFAAVVVVSILNAFVHSRDAYEAVVPDGLVLSAVAVALLLLTPMFARAVSRPRS